MTDDKPTPMKRTRRRGHNQGSIYQLKDGTWRGAVSFVDASDGKRRRKYVSGQSRASPWLRRPGGIW